MPKTPNEILEDKVNNIIALYSSKGAFYVTYETKTGRIIFSTVFEYNNTMPNAARNLAKDMRKTTDEKKIREWIRTSIGLGWEY